MCFIGPAFIKWGQWAATRPDVFPADVCEALSRLHMQVPHVFCASLYLKGCHYDGRESEGLLLLVFDSVLLIASPKQRK